MTAFRLVVATGLLAGVSAHAQASPDWSAYIGSGLAASVRASTQVAGSPATTGLSHSSTPSWNALIGTGQVSADADRRRAAVHIADGASQHSAHWTSKIGNGHVFAVTAHDNSREFTLSGSAPLAGGAKTIEATVILINNPQLTDLHRVRAKRVGVS